MDPKVIREQTIRDAKIGLILQSARKIFSEKGFTETRLEDIAIMAGFSKASLYNYFSDKEQIFLSIAVYDIQELQNKLINGLQDKQSFVSSLQFILRTLFTFFGENYAFILALTNHHILCSTAMINHADLVSNFKNSYHNLLGILSGEISKAQMQKEIRCDMDFHTLTRFIGSLIHGQIFEWKVSGGMGDMQRAIQEITDFSLSGVKYQGSIQDNIRPI